MTAVLVALGVGVGLALLVWWRLVRWYGKARSR